MHGPCSVCKWLCLNRTNRKDSHVRLRTNFLSITCCAMKGKEIMYFGANCHLGQLVGLSHVERLVLEFGSSNRQGSCFFFSLFLSFFPLLSFFFRVSLSVRVRFRVSVRVRKFLLI